MSKKHDIKKLTKEQSEKKLAELYRARMELVSEGKPEKVKGVKKEIARVLTHISSLSAPKKLA